MRSRSQIVQRPDEEVVSRRKKPKTEELKVPVSHDPVNEMVVIAAVMCDRKQADRLLPVVLPGTFYGKGHAEAWTALRTMQSRGLYFDPATVTAVSGGKVDVAYLEQILRDRPAVPPNLGYHVEMLMWDRSRIEAVRGPISGFLEALRDSTTEPERLRALAKQVGDAFSGFGSHRYLRDPTRLVAEQSKRLTARREGNAVFPFGIHGLDYYAEDDPDPKCAGFPRIVPGLAPGTVSMFTGCSGSGKSTAACAVAVYLANQERRVCFAAWETGDGPTLELCAVLSLGFSRTDLSAGMYDDLQQRELEEEMERLGEFVRFFELPFGRARGEKSSNDRNMDLIQQVIQDSHAEVFIADLMRRAMKETNPDDEEQACYRLQAMAKEQQAAHLWLHQLRLKDLEQRPDPRPTRDAVKGSSAWVEVPDTILGWHRPALFKSVPDDRMECIFLKQRWGKWPLAVEFDWDSEYGSITNGRSLEYARPGEIADVDSMLGESTPVGKKTRGWRR